MSKFQVIVLQRDTKAIVIPDGGSVVLPEGTYVRITQALGGTYSVMTDYGQMLRIDREDADALGLDPSLTLEGGGEAAPEGSLEDRVWAQLRSCYDPEIPVNIVDLGLIYNCELEAGDNGGRRALIKMTLTAPGCGMGDILMEDVKSRVESLPEIDQVEVEIVLDPPWTQDMMSEAARLELGLI